MCKGACVIAPCVVGCVDLPYTSGSRPPCWHAPVPPCSSGLPVLRPVAQSASAGMCRARAHRWQASVNNCSAGVQVQGPRPRVVRQGQQLLAQIRGCLAHIADDGVAHSVLFGGSEKEVLQVAGCCKAGFEGWGCREQKQRLTPSVSVGPKHRYCRRSGNGSSMLTAG